jgi:hypothetical protein
MSGQGSSIRRAIADQFESVETTLCLSNKVVVITEDRLELLLEDGIGRIASRNAWIAPAGTLASSIAALTTAKFQDFGGLSSATWQAIFSLVAAASLIWLFLSLAKRGRAFGRAEFMSSIRIAGTRLDYSEAAIPPSEDSESASPDTEGAPAVQTTQAVPEVAPTQAAPPATQPAAPAPSPAAPQPAHASAAPNPQTSMRISIPRLSPGVRIQRPPIAQITVPGLRNRGGVVTSFQCRRCGQALDKGPNRVASRCPNCGLVN